MAKFIPLTCEKCGGDLSVKEGLKYVTCSHCQTKFQVVQENQAVFLEKITVNIKNKIEQEYCEIVFDQSKTHFFFWAKAIGKDGVFSVGQTWELWRASYPYPSAKETGHIEAHNWLVLLLTKSGWQPVGRGDKWFSLKFSRTPLDDSKESNVYSAEAEFWLYIVNGLDKFRLQLERGLISCGKLSRKGLFGLSSPSNSEILTAVYKLDSKETAQMQDFTGGTESWRKESNTWIKGLAEIRAKVEDLQKGR